MIVYSVISPHPPILLPEIAGESIKDIKNTEKAMQILMEDLISKGAESIVFLTPHGNIFTDCISCLADETLYGDFSRFGRGDIKFEARNDLDLLTAVSEFADKSAIKLLGIDRKIAREHNLDADMDHGIMVPLYYLEKAGMKNLPILALSVGYLPLMDLYTFGKAIHDAARFLGKKIAIVASGDMSHRLKNEGTYDYHPDGPLFDDMLKNHIVNTDIKAILEIPENIRENAGECGYKSIVIMMGAMDGRDIKVEHISYEGPFGVGYLTAGFKMGREKESFLSILQEKNKVFLNEKREKESIYVKWARNCLEHYVKYGEKPELSQEMKELLQDKNGVFVSIKKNLQLRGCIGTISPSSDNLAEEIAENAIKAGTEDPRFFPVEENELDDLIYSVDVLSEAVNAEKQELDPQKYGVIVSSGYKKGLLLPDLPGVDTVEKQLEIALQKAGISNEEKYSIKKFEVKRFT